ncbi:NAD-dependent epimerase/dehydratase family protein [Chelativorans sp. AA-79]|uniref:NAD-dependent epimerase/dehydratase family protein n=1 Tax=Chelativorans sp. AA-79 TaxID=3028735 RepID=UPI0023F64F14|nr:NAD-dependent epimerase/dehydratase family protein [Chelativorans sp. AA-79]WEX09056.1 SDR family NAD(P)-dependent oxidoreductase [Chelativorans sp. AA-79]
MTIIVTGAAGFIGSHVARALMARGQRVVGIDNLNHYYDPALKQARLDLLVKNPLFTFIKLDISDHGSVTALGETFRDTEDIVHLAAQAGVRHSLTAPFTYTASNVTGHVAILELCRQLPRLRHLVYASSSSVYGGNSKLPFAVEDRVDAPASLYAATKRAGELMSYTYSHLYRIPTSGLRFFTVYGPWGRPDMAAYLFTQAILAGRPIRVFNNGDMRRDFTYIDDIVRGVLGVLDNPPPNVSREVPARIFNIGNNRAEPLLRFISVLEAAIGRKAELVFEPMQLGDVKETFADIDAIRRLCGFEPRVSIDDGLPQFVSWFRSYHGAEAATFAA